GFFNSSRSIHRENEYGGTVGGPIWIPKVYNGKNKSFFFFSYDGFKYRSGPGNFTASVPTADFRAGNFAALTNPDGSIIQFFDSGPQAALPSPVRISRDGYSGQRTARLSEDWIIRPTLTNHFSFGLTRQLQLLGGPEFGQPWAEKLGIKNVPNNGPFPAISISPFDGWGINQE